MNEQTRLKHYETGKSLAKKLTVCGDYTLYLTDGQSISCSVGYDTGGFGGRCGCNPGLL